MRIRFCAVVLALCGFAVPALAGTASAAADRSASVGPCNATYAFSHNVYQVFVRHTGRTTCTVTYRAWERCHNPRTSITYTRQGRIVTVRARRSGGGTSTATCTAPAVAVHGGISRVLHGRWIVYRVY